MVRLNSHPGLQSGSQSQGAASATCSQSPLRVSEATDPHLATSDLQVLNCLSLVPGTQALLWDCPEPSLPRKHRATDPLGLKNHRGRWQGKNTAPVSSLPLVPILSYDGDLAPGFNPSYRFQWASLKGLPSSDYTVNRTQLTAI